MDSNRARFEVYLELLNQIKLGNNNEESLMRSLNLPHRRFDELIDPLVSEKMLKSTRKYEGDNRIVVYELSDRGVQFIDFLMLGISYVDELEKVIRPAN